jgi:hypothetical protein
MMETGNIPQSHFEVILGESSTAAVFWGDAENDKHKAAQAERIWSLPVQIGHTKT